VSRKRSSFTAEFKDELVKLYLEQRASKTVSQVARENGVGPETLRNWVNAYVKAHPPGGRAVDGFGAGSASGVGA
jgi:transposase